VLQSHNRGALEAMLLPDYIEVEKTIQTRDQLTANLNICAAVSFKLPNHQTRMLSPDAAVIVYSGGESHLASNYNATTTWVRREGKWLVQMHTDIPVKP
jgi:hypothetical protein